MTFIIYIQIYCSKSLPRVTLSFEEWQTTSFVGHHSSFVLVQMSGVFGTYTKLHFNLHGMSSAFGVLGSALSSWLYIRGIPYYKTEMKRVLFRQMSSAFGVLGSALSSWLYIRGIPYYKAEMKRVLFRRSLEKKE